MNTQDQTTTPDSPLAATLLSNHQKLEDLKRPEVSFDRQRMASGNGSDHAGSMPLDATRDAEYLAAQFDQDMLAHAELVQRGRHHLQALDQIGERSGELAHLAADQRQGFAECVAAADAILAKWEQPTQEATHASA